MPRTTTRSASRPATERPVRDEDEPRSETPREQGTSTNMGRGREALRQHRENNPAGGGLFPSKEDKFKVGEDERVLIKFLDDDFFVTYYEHEFFKEFEGEKRQKTFICLGDDCPLCEIGDKPRFYALINVLVLGKKPAVKLWFATPGPGSQIEDQMVELEELPTPRTVADPDYYFKVSKKKSKNGFFEYSISRVKARDLEEDYDITPLTEREIESYAEDRWDAEFLRVNTRSELLEIAEELDRLQEGE